MRASEIEMHEVVTSALWEIKSGKGREAAWGEGFVWPRCSEPLPRRRFPRSDPIMGGGQEWADPGRVRGGPQQVWL